MPDLRWYVRRVKAMSPSEIVHRTTFHFKKSQWRRAAAKTWNLSGHRRSNQPREGWWSPLDMKESERDALVEEAEAYLERRWLFFGLHDVQERELDWHRDPSTGTIAPKTVFGFDINHRDEKVVGNIKMTWEKSRHHHLTVLASAYALTEDERFAKEVTDQIRDWIQQNPFLLGVHWTHPLEQAIRLIAWVWCERLLRGSESHARFFAKDQNFWACVYQHQWFIEQTYSRGSSANNHLIGEMAGLYIAASAWPCFERSRGWRRLAKKALEREMMRQTFPSGMNREQAFSYHLFTLEFFLLCQAEASWNDKPFSGRFTERLRSMLDVIPQVTDSGGNLPRYGDSDEGRAIQWRAQGDRRDTWLLEFGRVLFPQHDSRELGTVDSGKRSVLFEDAGLCVMRSKTMNEREVFVLFDAGPHGFLSIAAHAHADALSFALSVAGQPMLVDPGTYAYHTDAHWRDYFRSTAAHNTVSVGGMEQSEVAGAFLWTRQANTILHAFEALKNGAWLDASHDGFRRAGIECRRRMKLDGSQLTIEDELVGPGSHAVDLCFHAHPDCDVEITAENSVHVMRGGILLDVTGPNESSVRLARGERKAGWYSSAFGVKEETTTIFFSQATGPLTTFTTDIKIST